MKNKYNVLKLIKDVSIVLFVVSVIISINMLLEINNLPFVFQILNAVSGAFAMNAFIGNFDNE